MSIRPGIVGAFILGATGVGVAGILFFGGTRMFSETRHAVAKSMRALLSSFTP